MIDEEEDLLDIEIVCKHSSFFVKIDKATYNDLRKHSLPAISVNDEPSKKNERGECNQ